MALKSIEEAKEYIEKVREHLDALAELSMEAGFETHAEVWYGLAGIFLGSSSGMDEIKQAILPIIDREIAKLTSNGIIQYIKETEK